MKKITILEHLFQPNRNWIVEFWKIAKSGKANQVIAGSWALFSVFMSDMPIEKTALYEKEKKTQKSTKINTTVIMRCDVFMSSS